MIISNELPVFGEASGVIASRFLITTLTRSFFVKENIHLKQEPLADSRDPEPAVDAVTRQKR
jgi:hypothetical protein